MTKHVVVVGGGVIGLSTAYYLRREGADVTVLERATVGSGASWGNSGWIAPTFSAPLPGPGMAATALRALARSNGSFYLSVRHLPRLAPWLWRFWRASSAAKHDAGLHATAILALPTQRLYDELAADGVQFEMRHAGVIHAFLGAERAEAVRRKFLPFADLGYEIPDAVIDGRRLRELEPALGVSVAAGFVVPNERMVYPPSLLGGLRKRLTEMGATIREHQPVSGFFTHGDTITRVRSGARSSRSTSSCLPPECGRGSWRPGWASPFHSRPERATASPSRRRRCRPTACISSKRRLPRRHSEPGCGWPEQWSCRDSVPPSTAGASRPSPGLPSDT